MKETYDGRAAPRVPAELLEGLGEADVLEDALEPFLREIGQWAGNDWERQKQTWSSVGSGM